MLRCLKNYLILGWSICLVSGSGICLFGQSAEQKPIIKDKSPDGKFALQIVKKEEIGWEAAIISLKDKAAVVNWRSIKTRATRSSNKGAWSGRRIHKKSLISSRIVKVEARTFIFERS